MSNISFAKEAIIGVVTSSVAIPLLWLLTAAINPHRQVNSPGTDLAVMVLVGAGLVVVLRSTWRESDRMPDLDQTVADSKWREQSDRIGHRRLEPESAN